jgi:hypothetical protein
VYPSTARLRFLTAAALALAERDATACELVADVVALFAHVESDARVDRLGRAAEPSCGDLGAPTS